MTLALTLLIAGGLYLLAEALASWIRRGQEDERIAAELRRRLAINAQKRARKP